MSLEIQNACILLQCPPSKTLPTAYRQGNGMCLVTFGYKFQA